MSRKIMVFLLMIITTFMFTHNAFAKKNKNQWGGLDCTKVSLPWKPNFKKIINKGPTAIQTACGRHYPVGSAQFSCCTGSASPYQAGD